MRMVEPGVETNYILFLSTTIIHHKTLHMVQKTVDKQKMDGKSWKKSSSDFHWQLHFSIY